MFVSFIVPTINRPTLSSSLLSIEAQTDRDFEVVVVYDGHGHPQIPLPVQNARFFSRNDRPAGRNYGGFARNIGLERARGEWAAFLDDDDAITPDYVEKLRATVRAHPDLDVVLFRMNDPSHGILPVDLRAPLKVGGYGISFAVRMSTVRQHGMKFGCGPVEDRSFLTDAEKRGLKWLKVPDVCYIVRPHLRA